jgi:hypothetical protein
MNRPNVTACEGEYDDGTGIPFDTWNDSDVNWDNSKIFVVQTPIPVTVLLLGSGFLGLLGFRRRVKMIL